jgi:hypothetical protein
VPGPSPPRFSCLLCLLVFEGPLDEATTFPGIFVLGFGGFVAGCRIGRLIFATLHTNDAGALPRLTNMP